MVLMFNVHRELVAKRDGPATCKPGHAVKAGDAIGYAKRGSQTSIQCSACWARWVADNAEARMIEG